MQVKMNRSIPARAGRLAARLQARHGGIKPGVVVGSSASGGDVPKDRPVHIYDVLATIYDRLGVPLTDTYRDAGGRPVPVLPDGKPIAELI